MANVYLRLPWIPRRSLFDFVRAQDAGRMRSIAIRHQGITPGLKKRPVPPWPLTRAVYAGYGLEGLTQVLGAVASQTTSPSQGDSRGFIGLNPNDGITCTIRVITVAA